MESEPEDWEMKITLGCNNVEANVILRATPTTSFEKDMDNDDEDEYGASEHIKPKGKVKVCI